MTNEPTAEEYKEKVLFAYKRISDISKTEIDRFESLCRKEERIKVLKELEIEFNRQGIKIKLEDGGEDE